MRWGLAAIAWLVLGGDATSPPFPYHLVDQYQPGECQDQLWRANRNIELRESTARKSTVVAKLKKDQTARESGNDFIVGAPVRAALGKAVDFDSGTQGRPGQILYLLEEVAPGKWLAWLESEIVNVDQADLAPGAKIRSTGGKFIKLRVGGVDGWVPREQLSPVPDPRHPDGCD